MYCSGFSHGIDFIQFAACEYPPSAVPTCVNQLVTGYCDTAAASRLVCPITQAVNKPPPLPPVTARRFGIDVTLGNYGVDARHQILEIVTGIFGMNHLAKLLAVAGGSSWIEIQHHEAAAGVHLELVLKLHAIHPVRTTVNLEQQRILCRWIEVRWFYDPALNGPPIE